MKPFPVLLESITQADMEEVLNEKTWHRYDMAREIVRLRRERDALQECLFLGHEKVKEFGGAPDDHGGFQELHVRIHNLVMEERHVADQRVQEAKRGPTDVLLDKVRGIRDSLRGSGEESPTGDWEDPGRHQ